MAHAVPSHGGNSHQAPRSVRDQTAPVAQPTADATRRPGGPALSSEIEARQLSPEIRRELTTLDRNTADFVARHLVAAGELLDEDPEAALEHARAARSVRAGSPPCAKP